MILIACIGNIFLGDDAFGVEVARRLQRATLPADVVVKDFGIRGFDLTWALMETWDLVILVDACPRGGMPGDVYLIEPEPAEAGPTNIDAHSMNPMAVLRTVRAMGGPPNRLLLAGCEPADLGGEEGKLGLSDVVAAAVDRALALIQDTIAGMGEQALCQ